MNYTLNNKTKSDMLNDLASWANELRMDLSDRIEKWNLNIRIRFYATVVNFIRYAKKYIVLKHLLHLIASLLGACLGIFVARVHKNRNSSKNSKGIIHDAFWRWVDKEGNYIRDKEALKDFQYRAYIKNLHILLPNYTYRHSISEKKDKMFVGREAAQSQLLSFLMKGGKKGAYLITGFRGMGKTSLVNHTLDEYKKKKHGVEKVTISFGQKDVSELDILRQIIYEIKNKYDERTWFKIANFLNSNVYIPILIGISIFITINLAPILDEGWRPISILLINIQNQISEMKGESAIGLLIFSSAIAIIIMIALRIVGIGLFHPIINNHKKLSYLLDRCSSQLTSEESSGTGAEQFPIILAKRRSKAYPIAGAKEISNELIHLIKKIKFSLNIEFIFVFDELDKIDSNTMNAPHYEESELLGIKDEVVSFNDHRKRKRLILDILSSLKYLITEAEAKFIFIAGSEMFDAALADVSDRHSAISSIFGHVINVDSLYKDKDREQGELTSVGITHLIELFLKRVIDPDGRNKGKSLLKLDWQTSVSINSYEDRMKIVYSLQHFVNYLAYRSTGSPKKLIRLIEEHTTTPKEQSSNYRKNIYAKAHRKYKAGKGAIYLTLSYKDQYKIGLLNYFYRPVVLSRSRVMKHFNDSLLITAPYLMDHIHKFHSNAFSMENLELLPEVLSSSRAPELRTFLEELIEQFNQFLIRETDTRFFDYKFNFDIFSEIIHISSWFEEESAAYNFALDENHRIKVYLRLKIKDLRSVYQNFGGSSNADPFDSIALFNILLGDVSYFDREYSDAIGCYMDALAALRRDESKSSMPLSSNNFHFIAYVKCTMKIGLAYEKIKSYEKAAACYLDVIDVIGRNKTMESNHLLFTELNRYLMNAVCACFFVYEKKPSLGGLRRVFTKVMEVTKNKPIYFDNNNNVYSMRDFLISQNNFFSNLCMLLYYRNKPKDYELILKLITIIKERKKDLTATYIAIDKTKFSSTHDSLILLLKANFISEAVRETLDSENEKILEGNGYEEHVQSADVNHIFIENMKLLIDRYTEKSLDKLTSYQCARILARLGNVHYSVYLENYKGKENKYLRNKVSTNNVTAVVKSVIQTIIVENIFLKITKGDFQKEANASDLIKPWVKLLVDEKNKYKDENDENKSLLNIVTYYLLSAKLYMYSDRPRMGSYQYNKILSILRIRATRLRDYENRDELKMFLTFIEATLVKRCLQVASWNSSSTDRSQIYKYKGVFAEDVIYHDKVLSKHNYKNISNASDIKMAMWHYVVINEIANNGGKRSLVRLMNPSDIDKKDCPTVANQSFVSQLSSIHTMYGRLNELDVQCAINRGLRDNILDESGISNDNNGGTSIDVLYKHVRTIQKYRDAGEVDLKNGLLKIEIGKGREICLSYEKLKDLPYLLANWIFCLHNILQIMQTKGSSFLVTYTNIGDQYRRLGEVLKYFELCRVIHAILKKNLVKFPDARALVVEMIGDDALRSMDTTSLFQLATRNYRLAISAHSRGSAYRNLISNMYFLEDDFHDNLFHFSIAFERQRINSGEILDKIRELNKELSMSQYFEYESHVNGEKRHLRL